MSWVAHDDAEGARLVLDEMHASGARRTAYVGGTARDTWNIGTEGAYRQWMSEHGLESRVHHLPESAGEEGARGLALAVVAEEAPDAVFCLTGRQASGLMAGLRDHGVRIPEEVLLAAGSDSEQARLASPPISALTRAIDRLGHELVAMLEAHLRCDPPRAPLLVPTIYHSRTSTRRADRP